MHTPRVIWNDSHRSKWNSTGVIIPLGAAVKVGTGDDSMAMATSPTDVVIGLLADSDAASGEWQNIQNLGQAVGIAGTGGVTAGRRLTVDSLLPGHLVEANPAVGHTVCLVGVANRTAREGELFEVELAGPGASFTGSA